MRCHPHDPTNNRWGDSLSRPILRDLTGQRYGYLDVLCRAPNRGRKVYWHCRCRCGNEVDVQTFDLLFGKTRSCGCYRIQRFGPDRKD